MSTNNTPALNGNEDSGTDYEQIARDEKVNHLQALTAERVDGAMNEFFEAIENGENERQAYLSVCAAMLEFMQMAHHDLSDLGKFQYGEPHNQLLVRAIDTAAAASMNRHGHAAEYAADLADLLEESESE